MLKELKTLFWVKELAAFHRQRRMAAKAVAKAAKSIDPTTKTYLVGSTVDSTSTVYSDIDVLVCFKNYDASKQLQIKQKIMVKAMDEYGLPWNYPLELHLASHEKCERLLKRIPHEPVET